MEEMPPEVQLRPCTWQLIACVLRDLGDAIGSKAALQKGAVFADYDNIVLPALRSFLRNPARKEALVPLAALLRRVGPRPGLAAMIDDALLELDYAPSYVGRDRMIDVLRSLASARDLYIMERYDDVPRLCASAFDDRLFQGTAYKLSSSAYRRLQDHEMAFQIARRWCGARPADLDAAYILGVRADAIGSLEVAEEAFRRVYQGGRRGVKGRLAKVLGKVGKFDEQLDLLRELFAESPGNPSALDVVRTLTDTAARARALGTLEEMTRGRMLTAETRMQIAELFGNEGRYESAIEQYKARFPRILAMRRQQWGLKRQ
jgi:tetratricopeptide (TPR) repeat protein